MKIFWFEGNKYIYLNCSVVLFCMIDNILQFPLVSFIIYFTADLYLKKLYLLI